MLFREPIAEGECASDRIQATVITLGNKSSTVTSSEHIASKRGTDQDMIFCRELPQVGLLQKPQIGRFQKEQVQKAQE